MLKKLRGQVVAWQARGLQMRQAERVGVIGVGRGCAVGVRDQLTLALGVVVEVRDKGRPDRLIVGGRTAQVHVQPLEQVGLVERGARYAVVRRGDGYGPVERVVGDTGGERGRFQQC